MVWLLGLISLLYFNRVSYFKYAGLSRIDVFNNSSILLTQWRFIYFKKIGGDLARLPFLLESGENLDWMEDENMKYRVYFKLAMKVHLNQLQSKKFDANLFGTAEIYIPFLFDLCQSDSDSGNYILKIVNSETHEIKNFELNLNKLDLPPKLTAACFDLNHLPFEFVFKKTTYDLLKSEIVKIDEVIKPKILDN